MSRAPALFVSHGSPMFALQPGLLGPNLGLVGKSLVGMKAILVVSPHWPTRGVRVTGATTLDTIHDFGGFPAPLFAMRYPAKGEPSLAAEVLELLGAAGFAAELDNHADSITAPGCPCVT